MEYERPARTRPAAEAETADRLTELTLPDLDLATVDRVLHRAVELQVDQAAAPSRLAGADLVRVAAEVGVSEANLRRALAEVLASPEDERDFWAGLLAPDRVVESQAIAGTAADADRLVGEWMRQFEGMRLRRRVDGGGVWEKDRHLFTRIRMGLGMGSGGRLRSVRDVTHRVVPAGAGEQVVSMTADTSGVRAVGQAALAVGAAAGGAALVGAAVGVDGAAQLGALAGAAAGTAAWLGGVVWAVRARVGRIRDSLQRVLDGVADPAVGTYEDSLVGQIDRLRRHWWSRR